MAADRRLLAGRRPSLGVAGARWHRWQSPWIARDDRRRETFIGHGWMRISAWAEAAQLQTLAVSANHADTFTIAMYFVAAASLHARRTIW